MGMDGDEGGRGEEEEWQQADDGRERRVEVS